MEQGLLILQLSFDLPRMTRHIPTSASLQQNHESTVLAKPSLSKPSTVSVFPSSTHCVASLSAAFPAFSVALVAVFLIVPGPRADKTSHRSRT